MLSAAVKDVKIEFDETDHTVSLSKGSCVFKSVKGDLPYLNTKYGRLNFEDALQIDVRLYDCGVGEGILCRYENFEVDGRIVHISFETLIWIEAASEDIRFEWIVLKEKAGEIQEVFWPRAFEFDEPRRDWITVLPLLQGYLIPNDWQVETKKVVFDGQMCSCAAYMPWYGQIKGRQGYILISEHPWDCAYTIDHPANGPYTHMGIRWLASLGKMDYRRTVKMTLMQDTDYVGLCKEYRRYSKETGLFATLREKAARTPSVDKLIGSMFVHCGIKTHVAKDSSFYDPDHPEKNDSLVPFSFRTAQVKHYHQKGIRKLYLHLDGWGEAGYDNCHPDYLPACKEAGGWEGFKELSDTMQACGYMFGLHDQYRDYYFSARTFNKEFAIIDPQGNMPEHARWAGGRQTYLCASQAPYYVKRNFLELFEQGIHLEGCYLDVFTCNEMDECANPRHRMSRRECAEYRKRCFDFLLSRDILPSSEEVTDWAMNSLVFCHYGPYEFMLYQKGTARKGIPVPLFNLVYHDCMILPWPMERDEDEDLMLYALLNGGAPYLERDGAYPNTDGAFDDAEAERDLDEKIGRSAVVASLHEKIAKEEMVSHEFVDGNFKRQRTVFADGTSVEIDLEKSEYKITLGK